MKSSGLAAVPSFFISGLGWISKGLIFVAVQLINVFVLGWILISFLFAFIASAIYSACQEAESKNASGPRAY